VHLPPAKTNFPNQTPACKLIQTIFLLQSIIGLFLLLPYTCQTKLAKPNPVCILTQTISYCSPSLACSCCCPTPAKPNPCMYINPDYFLLQSIIGLFLLLPYTCQTKLAKPNPCMYINSYYFFLQSIIGLFLLLPYTCQTKPFRVSLPLLGPTQRFAVLLN
jgi:hypothetical protein